MRTSRSRSTRQKNHKTVELDQSSPQRTADRDLKSSLILQKKDVGVHSTVWPNPNPQRAWAPPTFGWWWEFGAIIVSLSSMALIIAILLAMNGKPLQHWKLPIQINSIVAVFSTFSRSALLLVLAEGLSQLKWNYFEKQASTLDRLQTFDDASRGPWGALIFFLKMKRGVSSLAAIGAALTVLALAFEPFTQQILEFPSREISITNGTAHVYTSEAFDLREWSPSTKKGGPKLTLLRSIVKLLPNPTARIDSHFVCPTGDCKMPAHWSLGACTDCENIPLGQVALKCVYGSGNSDNKSLSLEDFKSFALKYGASDYSEQNFSFDCRPYDPSSDTNVDYLSASEPKNAWFTVVQPFDLGRGRLYNYNITGDTDKYTSSHIITVDSIAIGNEFPKFEDLDKWPGFSANKTRCRVNYCVKETGPTILAKGHIQDSDSHDKELPLTFSNACGTDKNCSNITTTFHRPTNETWNIKMDAELRLQFGIDVAETLVNVIGMEMGAKYLAGLQAPQVATLTSTVISSFMRSSQNSKATNLTGIAFSMETYVYVRWEWSILPIVLVLVSVVFLVLTASESRSKEQLFKSSVLTGYFLRFEHPQEIQLGTGEIMNRLEKRRGIQYSWKDLLQGSTESRVQLIKSKEGEVAFI